MGRYTEHLYENDFDDTVAILGNGFDLNCGAATDYNSFYESFRNASIKGDYRNYSSWVKNVRRGGTKNKKYDYSKINKIKLREYFNNAIKLNGQNFFANYLMQYVNATNYWCGFEQELLDVINSFSCFFDAALNSSIIMRSNDSHILQVAIPKSKSKQSKYIKILDSLKMFNIDHFRTGLQAEKFATMFNESSESRYLNLDVTELFNEEWSNRSKKINEIYGLQLNSAGKTRRIKNLMGETVDIISFNNIKIDKKPSDSYFLKERLKLELEEKMHIDLLKHLKQFEDLFKEYLQVFVESQEFIDCKIKFDIAFNFNYTNIAKKMFPNSVVNYVHGSTDDDSNIIFGIDSINNPYSELNIFTKIERRTADLTHTENIEEACRRATKLIIYGHSLDYADRSILSVFLNQEKAYEKITIYYKGEESKIRIIRNLAKILTHERLAKMMNDKAPMSGRILELIDNSKKN